ncbi:hypothetical protein [Salinispora arenicola]|uniref:hypothetical protein n=1 Tax=Salinispora arenicola TaxID=168697 RepID=UPI00039E03FB|nr:hypothetical protein [Salinispora arenicola]
MQKIRKQKAGHEAVQRRLVEEYGPQPMHPGEKPADWLRDAVRDDPDVGVTLIRHPSPEWNASSAKKPTPKSPNSPTPPHCRPGHTRRPRPGQGHHMSPTDGSKTCHARWSPAATPCPPTHPRRARPCPPSDPGQAQHALNAAATVLTQADKPTDLIAAEDPPYALARSDHRPAYRPTTAETTRLWP